MKPVLILLLLISIVSCQDSSYNQETADKILEIFEQRNNVKELFKVWHMIFKKEYDYNTQEGIQKYVTFKKNLKEIQEHNSKNGLYQKGLNSFSDMTYEEFEKYYNLKSMSPEEMRSVLKTFISLDDYTDEEDTIKTKNKAGDRKNIDLRKYMTPVRDQGHCGSCWAFAAMGSLEGVYNVYHRSNMLRDWLSTQQLVDCDTNNNGCNGGKYTKAFDYLGTYFADFESQYKYEQKEGSCRYKSSGHSGIKTAGYNKATDSDSLYELLKRGPVAVSVNANSDFKHYKKGLFDGECSDDVNHRVTLVGWSNIKNNPNSCWIVKNSWGKSWGEDGYIYVLDITANNHSCNIELYGRQPNLA